MTIEGSDDPFDRNRSNRRAKRVLLALAIIGILLATLPPSAPKYDAPVLEFCVICEAGGVGEKLLNVLLFVPFGFAVSLLLRRRVLLWGAALSLGIEAIQVAIPGRVTSLADLALNAAGAGVGAIALQTRLGQWASERLLSITRYLLAPSTAGADAMAALGCAAVLTVWLATAYALRPAPPAGEYLADTDSLQVTGEPLSFGGNTYPDDNFEGRLDEVRIYRRARNREEINDDMGRSAKEAASDSDLVAAYGFDQGGTTAIDASRYGNYATVEGASWTSDGRIGGAIVLDGKDDLVLVPPAPQLDLSTGATLEVWVLPTSTQRRWASTVQKQVDAWFLNANSDRLGLRPSGGGTFGGVVEIVRAAQRIPLNEWTHLVLTYDGSVVRIYANGRQIAARQRWLSGTVLDADIAGMDIEGGPLTRTGAVRESIRSGAPIHVRAVPGQTAVGPVPLLHLRTWDARDVLFLGIDRDDLVLSVRRHADDMGMRVPPVRLARGMRSLSAEDTLDIEVTVEGSSYCTRVNATNACVPDLGLESGWSLLLYADPIPRALRSGVSVAWMVLLCAVPAFWARSRRSRILVVVLLGFGLLAIQSAMAMPAIRFPSMLGVIGGLVLGRALGRQAGAGS